MGVGGDNFKFPWCEMKAAACSPGGLIEVLYLVVMMKESKLTKFQQRHIMDTMKSKSVHRGFLGRGILGYIFNAPPY